MRFSLAAVCIEITVGFNEASRVRRPQALGFELLIVPADEEHAMDMAAFLLDYDADPSVWDLTDGLTAEENLRKHRVDRVGRLPEQAKRQTKSADVS